MPGFFICNIKKNWVQNIEKATSSASKAKWEGCTYGTGEDTWHLELRGFAWAGPNREHARILGF